MENHRDDVLTDGSYDQSAPASPSTPQIRGGVDLPGNGELPSTPKGSSRTAKRRTRLFDLDPAKKA